MTPPGDRPRMTTAAAFHPSPETLSAVLDDEVGPRVAEQVAEHLGRCDSCAGTTAELRTVSSVLGLIGGDRNEAAARPSATDDRRSVAVAAALGAGAASPVPARSPALRRIAVRLGSLAAVVAVLTALALGLGHLTGSGSSSANGGVAELLVPPAVELRAVGGGAACGPPTGMRKVVRVAWRGGRSGCLRVVPGGTLLTRRSVGRLSVDRGSHGPVLELRLTAALPVGRRPVVLVLGSSAVGRAAVRDGGRIVVVTGIERSVLARVRAALGR